MVTNKGTNLVFVLCTPRAGSTLLAAILSSHSLVYCPPETWLLLPLNAIAPNKSIMISTYNHVLAQEAWSTWYEESIFAEASSKFATSIYNQLLSQAGKQIFVDKTPRYYQILPWLENLFPNACKIWIKRNPLDVIASYKSSWGITVDNMFGLELTPNSFDNTVSYLLLESYFKEMTSKKYILKYEDLVSSPFSILQEICNFLNINMESKMLDFSRNEKLVDDYSNSILGDRKILNTDKIHSNSVGRWREVLSCKEVKQILEILGKDVFDSLGYLDIYEDASEWAGVSLDDGRSIRIREILATYFEYVRMEKDRYQLLELVASSRFYKMLRILDLWKRK